MIVLENDTTTNELCAMARDLGGELGGSDFTRMGKVYTVKANDGTIIEKIMVKNK